MVTELKLVIDKRAGILQLATSSSAVVRWPGYSDALIAPAVIW